MTGQDAVTIAERFNQAVGLDGIVLTKLDGDARGGAALSIRTVTGKPIVFCGVGEKVDALEAFHPDRHGSRILGMGDVLVAGREGRRRRSTRRRPRSSRRRSARTASRSRTSPSSCASSRRWGRSTRSSTWCRSWQGAKGAATESTPSAELKRFEAIIGSMTPGERRSRRSSTASRGQRIARGSGTSVQDVNRLLKQYAQLRKMMKDMKGMSGRLGRKDLRRAMPFFRARSK